jgi:hypothetical protein
MGTRESNEGESMIKVHYVPVLKCHNETHYFVQLIHTNKKSVCISGTYSNFETVIFVDFCNTSICDFCWWRRSGTAGVLQTPLLCAFALVTLVSTQGPALAGFFLPTFCSQRSDTSGLEVTLPDWPVLVTRVWASSVPHQPGPWRAPQQDIGVGHCPWGPGHTPPCLHRCSRWPRIPWGLRFTCCSWEMGWEEDRWLIL